MCTCIRINICILIGTICKYSTFKVPNLYIQVGLFCSLLLLFHCIFKAWAEALDIIVDFIHCDLRAIDSAIEDIQPSSGLFFHS